MRPPSRLLAAVLSLVIAVAAGGPASADRQSLADEVALFLDAAVKLRAHMAALPRGGDANALKKWAADSWPIAGNYESQAVSLRRAIGHESIERYPGERDVCDQNRWVVHGPYGMMGLAALAHDYNAMRQTFAGAVARLKDLRLARALDPQGAELFATTDQALTSTSNLLSDISHGAETTDGLRDDAERSLRTCPGESNSSEPESRWSGTWYNGAYTMQISGGSGSLSYTNKRWDSPGPYEIVDDITGSCTVKGDVATCREQAQYHDSEKTATRSNDVTMTLSTGVTPAGDLIDASSVITKATVQLKDGHPCPKLSDCTGMYPGAKFSGYFSRKKR